MITPLNPPATSVECSTCHGAGDLEVVSPHAMDAYDTVPCRHCHGTGRVEVEWCGRPGCTHPAVPGVHDHGVNLCVDHHAAVRDALYS